MQRGSRLAVVLPVGVMGPQAGEAMRDFVLGLRE